VSYDYDAVGNRTEMVDSTGTTTYEYDALNRLASVTFPGSRVVGYGYDALGRRTSITYPGGTDEVTYAYDEAGNVVSVTDWNDDETTYDYDDTGLLTTETYPNGVAGTFDYDNADRLTGIEWKKGANTLASVDYTLDAVGNRTQRVDGLGTHTYEYEKSTASPTPTKQVNNVRLQVSELRSVATNFSWSDLDLVRDVNRGLYRTLRGRLHGP
jgi:YD repeat-containing protein